MSTKQGSVGSAMTWIFVLSILLFWMPIVGPLIAGFVGGRKAGSLSNAVLAVLLPGAVIGVTMFLLATVLTGVPFVGALAGAGGLLFAFAHVGPLMVAAIIGAVV